MLVFLYFYLTINLDKSLSSNSTKIAYGFLAVYITGEERRDSKKREGFT